MSCMEEKYHDSFSPASKVSDAGRGYCKFGSDVVFTYRCSSAESVFLVGSFNGWSETDPFAKVSSDTWQICVPSSHIKDGDRYKFKVREAENEFYLTDPYALEISGPPYYDSVFRELPEQLLSVHTKCDDDRTRPMNVFLVDLSRYSGAVRYSDVPQELIPYMMQMGFTHVCFSGVLDEYSDPKLNRLVKACLAPFAESGGVTGFRILVRRMRESGIGVLLDLGVAEMCADEIFNLKFFTDSTRYWIESCGVDGLALTAGSEPAARAIGEMLEPARTECPKAAFYDINRGGIRIPNSDAVFGADDATTGVFAIAEGKVSEPKKRMADMSYFLISSGMGFTIAEDELGDVRCGISHDEKIQLFLSDLNALYLENSCLWRGFNAAEVKKNEKNVVAEFCGDHGRLIFAVDLSGCGCEADIAGIDGASILLDSYSERYGDSCGCAGCRPGRDKLILEPFEAVIAFDCCRGSN